MSQKRVPPKKDNNTRRNRELLVDLIVEYKYILTLLGVAVSAYIAVNEMSITIPPVFTRYSIQFVAGVVIALLPARFVYRRLLSDNRIQIHDVDPVSGDAAVYKLTEEQFKKLEIYDSEDEQVESEELHQIKTQTGNLAYEVTDFDPVNLKAYTTWWAGLRPREIRAKRKSLDYVRETYARKADKYDTIRDNLDLLVRDAVDRELSRRMTVEEGITNIDDASIRDSVDSAMQSLDVEQVAEKDDEIEKQVQEDVDIELDDSNNTMEQ